MCAGVNRRADPYYVRVLRKVEGAFVCALSLGR